MNELEKSEHKLFLPNSIMESLGCKNCVWKSNGTCPYGFTEPNQCKESGYCTELGEFILSLSNEGDSISAVKEKFFLYTQEMQSMEDFTKFKYAQALLTEFNSKEHPELTNEEYKQKKGELELEVNTYKIWWSRLTDSVVKGLGKIADRESRSKDIKGTQKITIQQLNVLLKKSDKVLENQ